MAMKPAQIAVLGTAVVAAAAAGFLVMGRSPPPPAAPVAQPLAKLDILVASKDIYMGAVLKADDLRWQSWAEDSLPPGAILKTEHPDAEREFAGMSVQSNLAPGQPVMRAMLVKNGSYMASVLPAGKRAFAISIDSNGDTSAGNFIQPNDRVDVVVVSSDDNKVGAFTILRNMRVLAIGSALNSKDEAKTSSGVNATLEVTPAQAELLARTQKQGRLVLTLRSVADADSDITKEDNTVTLVRNGIMQFYTKQ